MIPSCVCTWDPHENFDAAKLRKKTKYEELVGNCVRVKWNCTLHTIEIGTRGTYTASTSAALRSLGMSWKETKSAVSDATKIALRGSYYIYLARDSKDFTQVPLAALWRIIWKWERSGHVKRV